MANENPVSKPNHLRKIVYFPLAGFVIWHFTGAFGLPVWWQIEFIAFVAFALILFILLDLPSLSKERFLSQTNSRIFFSTAIPTVFFISITAGLPQFNPQVEVEALSKPPCGCGRDHDNEINLIDAGRQMFESNRCFECHKVFSEGHSDRGPNLGTKQIGLFSRDYISEQIIDPRKSLSPGFEDAISAIAMPTYYGEDLSKVELQALVAYLKTLRDPTSIPVEGKVPNQWTWWDDPKIIAEGKLVYEGKEPMTEGLNCAVCHGADGAPMITGAFDFRSGDNKGTDVMPVRTDKKFKDWPDNIHYQRITRGVDGTAMAPWGMMFDHLYLWKAEVYARTFHSPLESRTHKIPVPSIPTKEEVAGWKTAGLFLDPLL